MLSYSSVVFAGDVPAGVVAVLRPAAVLQPQNAGGDSRGYVLNEGSWESGPLGHNFVNDFAFQNFVRQQVVHDGSDGRPVIVL